MIAKLRQLFQQLPQHHLSAMQTMSDKSEKLEFREFFRFTRDGKMKSGTVTYSITFAALYLVVYGAAYYFLIDVLAPMTADMAIWLSDLIGALVPGLVGAIVCLIPLKLLFNKKPAFLGYVWIAIFAVLFLIVMIIMLKDDRDALAIFLRLFLIMVPVPLLLGGGSAWYFWKKSEKMEKSSEDYD